jgi:hypothetical protein
VTDATRATVGTIDPLDVATWALLAPFGPEDGYVHKKWPAEKPKLWTEQGEHSRAFLVTVRETRRRVAAAVEGEPWLPIDEAARLASQSPSRVRKGATKRKRNSLPLLLDDNGKPVKPYRVRVSDVRAWAARAVAAKENAATKAAIPGHGATSKSPRPPTRRRGQAWQPELNPWTGSQTPTA